MSTFCEKCDLALVCERRVVTVPSAKTVRDPAFRLECQNWLADLKMPYRKITDFLIGTIALFPGRYQAEDGTEVPVPGFAPWLVPGIDWWVRDFVAGGPWATVEDVPRLRSEAARRFVLIAVSKRILETVWPSCR